MISCLPDTGPDKLRFILFLPCGVVSTFPVKHSQLANVPDSKSRLGGQEDWLYAVENKHTIQRMQVTALTIIIKRVKMVLEAA
jgi:hypothetical protein